jgi:hypothetical protein
MFHKHTNLNWEFVVKNLSKAIFSTLFCCFIVSVLSTGAHAKGSITQVQNGVLINQQGQILAAGPGGITANINQSASPRISVDLPSNTFRRGGITQVQNGVLISQQAQTMVNNFGGFGNVFIGGNTRPVYDYRTRNFNRRDFRFDYFARPNYARSLRRPISNFNINAYFCEFQGNRHAFNDGYSFGEGAGYEAAHESFEDICDLTEIPYGPIYTPRPVPTPIPAVDYLVCRGDQYKAFSGGRWICITPVVCAPNETKIFINGEYICRPTDVTPRPVVCPLDLRRCADGTFVSRDPEANCQFRACPVTPTPNPTPNPTPAPGVGQRCETNLFCNDGTQITGTWTRQIGRAELICIPLVGSCRESRPPILRPNIAVATSFNNNQVQTESSNENLNQVEVSSRNN